MAPYSAATLFLVCLFGLCSGLHGRSRRFGVPARTLHTPVLSESEKWGEKFIVMRAEGILSGADDVDQAVRPLGRFRRDATRLTPPTETEAHLNDSHTTLIVHWAGEGSDVIIALAKGSVNGDAEQSSKVYVSWNYGENFTDITPRFVMSSLHTVKIDKYYNSELRNSHYVFADVTHKCLFMTRNYARTFTRHCDLPFQPKVISLHPNNPNYILAFDPDSRSSQLYLSRNFGQSFEVIRSDVKAFFWGVAEYDSSNTLYVEEKRATGGNVVVKTENFFQYGRFTTVVEGVEDFEVQDEYLFATKKPHLYGSDLNGTLQFWVSHNRGRFFAAEFPGWHNHTDYYVADASEDQVMLCVTHNNTVTHLYISDVQGSRFSLSLENIVFFNPKGANKDTWLGYYTNETFADIHKVAGLRGIYIASQLVNGSLVPEHQRSLITFDKGGEWELLTSPRQLHGRPNYNCSKNANCSLHVTQELMRLYPGSQAQPLMSRVSAPGLILASGTVGANFRTHLDMFVSADAGVSWNQVLEGNYIYTMADHGQSWTNYKFITNETIRIYGVLTEPGEKTTVFSIFGSKLQRHSWLLIQLNMSAVLGTPCTDDDYKAWSLPDTNPIKGCLLGRKRVISRRIAHATCYNGRDFVRVIRTENCSCTREDFECDFGWRLSNLTNRCVVDPRVPEGERNSVPHPCRPGSYYQFSRGYRRVAGDTCSGGREHQYASLQYSCPIQERPEFLLVASRKYIQSLALGDLTNSAETVVRLSNGMTHITAVAFDYAGNRIFWSTGSPAAIFSRNMTGSSVSVKLAEGRMQEVTSLAYDWTADTLYWTDAGERTIEMMRADGAYRRRLIFNNTQVIRPARLVVDPHHG
ncbi:hypothetical protein BaRGS_00035353 [Batillaria attramentaria]|uniref:VPS10 domain-containing protein n=1 Tax=Batillaria attramentaria TaxID=370345 RepID=A0ABD0JEK4_9CAEN